jgi:peptidoglycan/LPS O-acetylase OafA/YrhL
MPFSHAAITDNEIWKEKAYLPGMSAIALGVIAALVAARWPARRRAVTLALGGFGVAGIAIVMLAMPWLWPLLHDAVLLVLSLATACLLVALHGRAASGQLRALPGSGWLRSMGRLSYEIYLGHMFVVFAVVAAFKASGGDARYGFLWYVPGVLLAWLLGAVVAHAYSIPCDRALRRRLLKASSATPAFAAS